MERERKPIKNLNDVYLEGNLLSNPTLRLTETGPWCNFDLAFNELDVTICIGISATGGLANWCDNSLSKGDRIIIKGRLVSSRWENDHGKQRRVELRAMHIKLLDGIPV